MNFIINRYFYTITFSYIRITFHAVENIYDKYSELFKNLIYGLERLYEGSK